MDSLPGRAEQYSYPLVVQRPSPLIRGMAVPLEEQNQSQMLQRFYLPFSDFYK